MALILSIDQGTTSSRAILFETETGDIKAVEQRELPQIYPQSGWVEHDPMNIWQDSLACARKIISQHKNIVSIGITNQRETTIVWDRETGQPIYNAVVWQDRRTADYCAELKQLGHEKMVQQKTGLLCDPYFSGTKIRWILENVDGAKEKAKAGKLAFGTVDCWLLWHLTEGKVHATDCTNASRTMLYNIHTQKWDDELLELLDIPKAMLPEVLPNAHDFGVATALNNIPIQGMCGDQQAATIGQACFEKGSVKSTYGTGCFVLMNTADTVPVSRNKLLITMAYMLDKPVYAIEGSIFNAGTAIQWLRDGLGIIAQAAETEALARSVTDNAGVYFIPSFTGQGAPYWQPEARGMITGLNRNSSKAHIVRAALEAQAYQTRDLLEAMTADSGVQIKTLRVDGGMVKNNFVCQALADILQVEVDRPKIVETTALGAAYCAGLQAGIYKDQHDLAARWQLDKRFTPQMSKADADVLYKGWKAAISQQLSVNA
jgi:glycerol kinase